MGKDQDLLEAARKGDTATIERILCQKNKKSALALAQVAFASLRRVANPICQDVNGCTPLHYAALHGHRGAVSMLLKYEASANISDQKGCSPLHLAAWNGHDDICEILLTQGPSLATVNTQNLEGETALHCASQHGHAQVVTVLLKHLGDPSILNAKNESPLDLAALYGRLDTVHQLLKDHPKLIHHQREHRKHSPLHLASRNGHTHVVSTLLEAGFDINTQTESGTCLHEAALFGKQEVVRLLLSAGIDVNLTDGTNKTAIDLLGDLQGRMSMDVAKLIGDHMEMPGGKTKKEAEERSSMIEEESMYDTAPNPRPKPAPRRPASSADNSPKSNATKSSTLKNSPKKIQIERDKSNSPSRHVNRTPPPVPPHAVQYGDDGAIYDVPVKVKPVQHVTSHGKSSSPKSAERSPAAHRNIAASSSPTIGSTSSPDTPKKPPRRKHASPVINNQNNNNGSVSGDAVPPGGVKPHQQTDSTVCDEGEGIYEYLSSAVSGSVRRALNQTKTSAVSEKTKNADAEKAQTKENENVVEINKLSQNDSPLQKRDSTKPTASSADNQKTSSNTTSSIEENKPTSTERPVSQERPPSLEFDSRRVSKVTPLSPTGYEQPPTPEFPPPSPQTAVLGIQEKINPKEKRKSRDIETITEQEFLAPENPNTTKPITADEQTETDTPPEVSSDPPSTSDSCAQNHQDNHTNTNSAAQCSICPPEDATNKVLKSDKCSKVEEVCTNGNNPFLGLIKGSKPRGVRRVKSQIYDNIIITSQKQKLRKRRISAPGDYNQFETVTEKGEVSKDSTTTTSTTTTTVLSQSKCLSQSCSSDDKGFRSEEEINADFDMFMEDIEKKVRESRIETVKNSDLDGREEGSPLDENEEWAKIASIMSSFGGHMSTTECSDHSFFEAQLQRIFSEGDSNRMQSVGDWLDTLGLGQYENTLVANGFDDMDFEGSNILEEQDLVELGITNEEHRKSILDSAKSLPPLIPIGNDNMPSSVEKWLQSLRLSQYLENFLNNGYTSMDRVRKVWELELNTVLDISTLGHRKRILASLANRPEEERPDSMDKTNSITDLNWNLSPLSDKQDSESSSSGADINLYKDYTMLRPNYQGSEVTPEAIINDLVQFDVEGDSDADRQGTGVRDSRICIRPPHLMIDTSPVKQWRHRPEVLIKGCCNYTAQYLGSCLVKQLLGVESTRESIIKMRKTGDTIAKLPNIVLSISYKGVKFIDARSKRVICEHEIGNIFCACQDGEDLTHFAYITKDLETDKHYCHVFSVRSMELATEIILTLGEAFEVAYQVAMKEKSEVSAKQFDNQLSQRENHKGTLVSSSGESSN